MTLFNLEFKSSLKANIFEKKRKKRKKNANKKNKL